MIYRRFMHCSQKHSSDISSRLLLFLFSLSFSFLRHRFKSPSDCFRISPSPRETCSDSDPPLNRSRLSNWDFRLSQHFQISRERCYSPRLFPWTGSKCWTRGIQKAEKERERDWATSPRHSLSLSLRLEFFFLAPDENDITSRCLIARFLFL